jgi:hypothetical protein
MYVPVSKYVYVFVYVYMFVCMHYSYAYVNHLLAYQWYFDAKALAYMRVRIHTYILACDINACQRTFESIMDISRHASLCLGKGKNRENAEHTCTCIHTHTHTHNLMLDCITYVYAYIRMLFDTEMHSTAQLSLRVSTAEKTSFTSQTLWFLIFNTFEHNDFFNSAIITACEDGGENVIYITNFVVSYL